MRQYGDPQIVAIAYNWGEGNTNRWLKNGADPRRLPKETQNYLDKFVKTAFAQGGEVEGYAEGGEVNAQSYSEKMKKAFGYEPFHGPAMQKYMSGGEVQHFEAGGLKLPPRSTSAAGDFFRSIGVDDAINAVREGYYKDREFQNRQSAAEDMYPGLFESMTPEERARRIAAGDTLFKGPQTVPKLTPQQIEEANAKIKAVPPKESINKAPADPRSNVASRTGPPEAPPETVVEQGPQMSIPTKESLDDVFAALNEKPVDFPKVEVDGLPTDDYAELMKEIKEAKTASAKQRKEDKAYAMIMAGLATMGGESPNALVNIAKGQAAGLGMLQENRKQSAAEDAKLLQMQGTVLRYKDAALLAKEAQSQREDYRKRDLDLREQIASDNRTAKGEKLLQDKQAAKDRAEAKLRESLRFHSDSQMRKAKVLADARYAAAKNAVLPDEQAKLIAEGDKILSDAEDALLSDPIYLKGMKELFKDTGIDFTAPKPPAPPAKLVSLNDMPKKP